jgi:hypothetical protein
MEVVDVQFRNKKGGRQGRYEWSEVDFGMDYDMLVTYG